MKTNKQKSPATKPPTEVKPHGPGAKAAEDYNRDRIRLRLDPRPAQEEKPAQGPECWRGTETIMEVVGSSEALKTEVIDSLRREIKIHKDVGERMSAQINDLQTELRTLRWTVRMFASKGEAE